MSKMRAVSSQAPKAVHTSHEKVAMSLSMSVSVCPSRLMGSTLFRSPVSG